MNWQLIRRRGPRIDELLFPAFTPTRLLRLGVHKGGVKGGGGGMRGGGEGGCKEGARGLQWGCKGDARGGLHGWVGRCVCVRVGGGGVVRVCVSVCLCVCVCSGMMRLLMYLGGCPRSILSSATLRTMHPVIYR